MSETGTYTFDEHLQDAEKLSAHVEIFIGQILPHVDPRLVVNVLLNHAAQLCQLVLSDGQAQPKNIISVFANALGNALDVPPAKAPEVANESRIIVAGAHELPRG